MYKLDQKMENRLHILIAVESENLNGVSSFPITIK